MVTKPINRRQDAKIHTSIIAQNLHRPNKHQHLLLPALIAGYKALALIVAFKRRKR
jgi:hypothetical protein